MANREIYLGNTLVNNKTKPYLIAEIGINHNGDLQIAKRLIDATFAIGWNCVKFQKRMPSIAVPEWKKDEKRDTPWGVMTYLDYKKHIEFEKKEYDYIDRYCLDKPISWTASPWDLPSLDFLIQYDIPFIKIASATNSNKEILKKACESQKPILLSTGMSTIEEIDESVKILERYGNGDYILLHTNSTYPTPHNELNLRMIETLQKRYECLVGYSGHETDLEPSVVATIMGAKVIERHITLSHDMWGTDQKSSLTIHAMDMLYNRIAGINEMIGNGIKTITQGEEEVRKKLRV